MIGLLADVGSGYFLDLSGGSDVGLSGPVGLGDTGGFDSIGLTERWAWVTMPAREIPWD